MTRAAASLPTLILIALAPKKSQAALLVLVGVGLFAVLRNRTAGVMLFWVRRSRCPVATAHPCDRSGDAAFAVWRAFTPVHLHQLAMLSSALLLAAALPYLRPMIQFVRGR